MQRRRGRLIGIDRHCHQRLRRALLDDAVGGAGNDRNESARARRARVKDHQIPGGPRPGLRAGVDGRLVLVREPVVRIQNAIRDERAEAVRSGAPEPPAAELLIAARAGAARVARHDGGRRAHTGGGHGAVRVDARSGHADQTRQAIRRGLTVVLESIVQVTRGEQRRRNHPMKTRSQGSYPPPATRRPAGARGSPRRSTGQRSTGSGIPRGRPPALARDGP